MKTPTSPNSSRPRRCPLTDRRRLVHILAVAVLLRLVLAAVASVLGGLEAHHAPDTSSYLEPATEFVDSGSFTRGGDTELLRTPAYPALLALGVALGNVAEITVALQILLSTATAAAVYAFARQLFGVRSARVAALLYALEPLSVIYSTRLLSETLFTAAFAVALWLISLEDRRSAAVSSRRDWLLSVGIGFCLALASLTRPLGLVIILAALLVLGVCALRRGRRGLPALVLMASVGLLPPLLWQARNQAAGYSGLSGIADINLYFYQGAAARAAAEGRSFYELQKELGYRDVEVYLARHPEQREWSLGKRLGFMRRQGWAMVADHPFEYGWIHLKGVLRILVDPGGVEILRMLQLYPQHGGLLGRVVDDGIFATLVAVLAERPGLVALELVLALALVALYSLVALGVRSAPSTRAVLVALVTTTALLLASGGPQALSRFRHPVMPVLCLFGGAGLVTLVRSRQPGMGET